jgi:tetratricopeptide (TPR) repeat protein
MDGKQLWVETTVSPDDFESWALAELSHIENGSGEPGMLASLHAARANRLPKFRDDVQAEQSMARYTEGLARHLEDEIAKVEAVIGGLDTEATDVEDCMSTTIEAMTAWKASKDTELGIALRDAVISADAARATGNHKFQTGRFIESFEEYKIGIQCLEGFSAHTLSADARKLHVTLLLNACQALLKTRIAGASSEGAYELASKALALEPTNIKALYRRGCACAISGNDHLARDDFEQVLRLDPLNVAAKDQLRNLGVMLEESRPKPNHTSANHASTNHASSKVGPSTLQGQSPDHASTKVSTNISLNSRASPSKPPKAAQGSMTPNLAQSLTEASPGSHPIVSCGCAAGDQVQWRGVDDPMPSGGVGTVVSVTESKVQVRFANYIRFCSPDEIVKVTSPVATPAPSCSLAVVFFDFDSTLSSPQYVHRANDYAVCDRIELCCSLTEDEVIANFGGPERLANLLDMLEYLEQGGVNLFIISLGFTRAISHHLAMVNLDRFFDSDRIFGQDSEPQAASTQEGESY